ncbi:MAG: formylglycine-generating enzyme family protein [Phycisphaerae bacterium]|nr:SUMF1/EgtB/PvdO family nonheme iron enzyme [Tepidisphaeraceae bacterium]
MNIANRIALAVVVGFLGGPAAGAADKPEVATEVVKGPGFTPVDFKLVKLPGGRVTLKDADGTERAVDVKPVWMGVTEVTWDLYEPYYTAVDMSKMEAADAKQDAKTRPSVPYMPPTRNWGKEGMPAGSITFKEAGRFCKWVSERTGKKYRLPTDAEWQWACQAGRAGAAGKTGAVELAKTAWFANNSEEQPHLVGAKPANAWGLHDMLGNVGEWVTRDGGQKPCIAGGHYQDEAADVHAGRREEHSLKKWQDDPQEPKGVSWLSTGPFVGLRLVRED